MDGYTILAGFLIFFLLFIYLTWFGFSVKVENEKEEQASEIKINPYDNLPLSRRLIDKKNSKVGIFDLGNHILIIGVIFLFIYAYKTFAGHYDQGKRGWFTTMKGDYVEIEILGLYWHFVDLVWVFIFAFFYLW